jgi:hypothetical protein
MEPEIRVRIAMVRILEQQMEFKPILPDADVEGQVQELSVHTAAMASCREVPRLLSSVTARLMLLQ